MSERPVDLIAEPMRGPLGGHRRTRVLYVGADYPGSNSTSLRNAIIRNGHECLTVPMWSPDLRWRFARKLKLTSDQLTSRQAEWDRGVARIEAAWKPDLVVVFKGLWLSRETVSGFSALTVHYHPDDSSSPYNRSAVYAAAETAYDLHVTTKSFNVPELRSRGVRNALYVRCAFDRDWHVPLARHGPPRYVVGFIGSMRPDRQALIRTVADRWGRQAHIAGAKWRRDAYLRRTATVTGPKMAFDLSIAVSDAPVQLGLLNSYNRDLHTCRSYEVAAAGGVLIGERTSEHQEMLEDGAEALFFSSEQELHDHIRFLEQRPSLVRQIGDRASARVRRDGSTYEDRWLSISRELSLD